MTKLKPGFAFWLVCDRGFAVGLMTHHVERIGHVVWLARPFFDAPPTAEDVGRIEEWRWPIFFPLGAAVRRKIVTPIGVFPIPAGMEAFPMMRSRAGKGSGKTAWNLVKFVDGSSRSCGPTSDSSLPIYSVVNDTRLKEMLVSDWAPEQQW